MKTELADDLRFDRPLPAVPLASARYAAQRSVEPSILYAAVQLDMVCPCGTALSVAYLALPAAVTCRWCGRLIRVRLLAIASTASQDAETIHNTLRRGLRAVDNATED